MLKEEEAGFNSKLGTKMESNPRESRRKRLADRGADRLAFITGQHKSLPHNHRPLQIDDTSSAVDTPTGSSLLRKCMTSTEILRTPVDPSPEVQQSHPTTKLQEPHNTTELQQSEAPSATQDPPKTSMRVVFPSSQIISAKGLSSSISATENVRLVCAAVFGFLVVLATRSYPSEAGILTSVIVFRPLYLLLLTDITIVLGLVLMENQEGKSKGEEGKRKGGEGDDWTENVGKALEFGLLAQKALSAAFMDCSVYAVVLISGLSLRQYWL